MNNAVEILSMYFCFMICFGAVTIAVKCGIQNSKLRQIIKDGQNTSHDELVDKLMSNMNQLKSSFIKADRAAYIYYRMFKKSGISEEDFMKLYNEVVAELDKEKGGDNDEA